MLVRQCTGKRSNAALIVVEGVLTVTVRVEGGSQGVRIGTATWPLTIWLRVGRGFLSKAHATNGTRAAHIAIRPNEIPVAAR